MELSRFPKTRWKLVKVAVKKCGYALVPLLLFFGAIGLWAYDPLNDATSLELTLMLAAIVLVVQLVQSIFSAIQKLEKAEREFIVEGYSKLLWKGFDARKQSSNATSAMIEEIVRTDVLVENFNKFSILDFDEAVLMFKESAEKGLSDAVDYWL
jgi:hypothetical protein